MTAEQTSNQPALPPDQAGAPGPVVAMSAGQRRALQACFDRGKAVLKQNDKPDRDYAHTMFAECVVQDPANLEYVEAMLENLQRKYNNNKKGSRFAGFASRGGFKKSITAGDWDEVFDRGLELLKANPWDAVALRGLAEACKANRYNEVELRYLKNALDATPKDIELCRHCAESLARMGQFDQAIAMWHRIEEIDKKNVEARRMVSELSLAKQRGVPFGVESTSKSAVEKSSAQPKSSSEPEAAEASAETAEATPTKDGQPTSDLPTGESNTAADPSRIETLEKAVTTSDATAETYLQLAEAYTNGNRLRDAYRTLKQGLASTGGINLKLMEAMEDAQIRMTRQQVAVAESRAKTDPSDDAADLAKRFRTELNRQEIQVFSARSGRYPDDLSLQYDLGIRLKRDSNFWAAKQAFEAARQQPDLTAAATLELGECLQHLKQYTNAMKCYQAASEHAESGSEIQKLALFRTGVLATALKNLEAAEAALSRLVEKTDADYRDARERLDKLRQISNSD